MGLKLITFEKGDWVMCALLVLIDRLLVFNAQEDIVGRRCWCNKTNNVTYSGFLAGKSKAKVSGVLCLINPWCFECYISLVVRGE